jgi:error-prone DNA polymerase
MTERYVELHARSAFSFLEGASLPEAMTQQAANLELPGLAILDRDGLYGSPRLYTTAKKLGLRSHIGAKVSVDSFGQQVQPPSWQPHTVPSRPVRLSLLCESQTGYRNLSLLISSYKLAQPTKGDGLASLCKVQEPPKVSSA